MHVALAWWAAGLLTGPTAQAHLEQRERALAGTTLRLSQVPPSAPRPVLSCPPPPSLEKHAPCSAVLLPFSRQHSCHRMYLSHHLSEQTSFHKQLCGKQVNPRSCLWRPRPPPPCLALSAPGGAPLFKPSTAAAHKESAVPLSLRMRRLAQNCCLTSFHSPVLLWTRWPSPPLPCPPPSSSQILSARGGCSGMPHILPIHVQQWMCPLRKAQSGTWTQGAPRGGSSFASLQTPESKSCAVQPSP